MRIAGAKGRRKQKGWAKQTLAKAQLLLRKA